eukprot:2498101-Prymnesium_polylepis.1
MLHDAPHALALLSAVAVLLPRLRRGLTPGSVSCSPLLSRSVHATPKLTDLAVMWGPRAPDVSSHTCAVASTCANL